MSEPIVFFNRHTGVVERERIYGEGPLRWVYETAVGRLALWALVRRGVFSRWFGWRMRGGGSRWRVGEFVREFGLDAGEFERGVGEFVSFDDFFSRKLRPGARLVEGGGDVAVFPADGRHLGFEDVSRVGGIYAKGQVFDLGALLGDGELAERYRRGAVVCSRLCPVDYHRFHFPVGGRPAGRRLLNGWLYSVSPVALRRNVAWLWENKRCCVSVDAGAWGVVTVVVIGATNVGSMTFTFREGEVVEKGAEMGFFGFGGSFMVTLFEPGRIALAGDLVRESAAGRELYVRMGGELGRLACAG